MRGSARTGGGDEVRDPFAVHIPLRDTDTSLIPWPVRGHGEPQAAIRIEHFHYPAAVGPWTGDGERPGQRQGGVGMLVIVEDRAGGPGAEEYGVLGAGQREGKLFQRLEQGIAVDGDGNGLG